MHFVGIGGAGLSGDRPDHAGPRASPVSGSDDHDTPFLAGAARARRHAATSGTTPPTSATPTPSSCRPRSARTTPRCAEARRRGLRVLPRSAGAGLGDGRAAACVAVAGTHGKTTTTSLLTVALQAGGADPTYAIGGDAHRDRAQRRRRAAATCSSPRPTRATAPSWSTAPTPRRHQRRGRPPRPLGHRGGLPRGVRRRSPTAIDPDGFLVCCVDDPGRAASPPRVRARGGDVVGVGESDGGRPASAGPRVRRRDVGASRWSTGGVELRRGHAADPGPALRPRRAGGAGRRAAARLRLRRAARAGSSRSPAPGGGWSPRARPAASGSTTATPTTRSEIAGDLAGRPRASPATGRLVVAFQPHLVSRTRIFGAGDGRGARRRRRGRGARRLPRPRGRRPGGHRARWSPTPCPSRRSGSPSCRRPGRAPRTRSLARARPGDLVLTLGAGDVTEVGPRVLALLEERADA